MKVSMNGLRRSMSGDIESLRDIVDSVLRGDFYEADDLRNAMNDVIRASNVLNCVFHKGDPDFSDMGEVEVPLLEDAP